MARPSNLTIAQAVTLRPLQDVAAQAGLMPEDFEMWGPHKAKLTWTAIDRLQQVKKGKLILVTAITPTPAGEGKTTVTIGLTQGLNQIGRQAIACVREPALGPVFGAKGGATGGGHSQVLPMEDINLFFTGDFPAVAAAHNLLAAMLDAHIHNGNQIDIDIRQVTWPRTVDMNDRALRRAIVGIGGSANGFPREAEWVITPASEVMAILGLASSLDDLTKRLGNILVARTRSGAPVRAHQLGAAGAMAMLLRDAMRPNLVQTVEGGPAFVHGGPFANIAHGTSTILAARCALGLAEFVVTEGGFASDLGTEKFCHLVVPQLGAAPDAIVLVATIKALRYHGEGELSIGLQNLGRHLDHVRQYGVPVIVTLNLFSDDVESEIQSVNKYCKSRDVVFVASNPWNGGGAGCTDLARALTTLSFTPFAPIVDAAEPIQTRLQTVVSKVYGGRFVKLTKLATKKLEWMERHGMTGLPVCIAKTQMSLSDEPGLRNAPTDFDITISDFRPSLGAGFIVAIAGDMMLMPGLGAEPSAHRMSINNEGAISGLV